MKMKMPKLPVLITTRDDGRKEFIGLTPKEWVVSTVVLCGLYVILAGFFAVLLVIAQTIRNGADFVSLSYPSFCPDPSFLRAVHLTPFHRWIHIFFLQYSIPGSDKLTDDDNGDDENSEE